MNINRNDLIDILKEEEIDERLLKEIDDFRKFYKLDDSVMDRVASPRFIYYGSDVWNKAITAILSGFHILLSGPKATGKNVLSENLSLLFNRPMWTVSLNVNTDAESLIGSDTFKSGEVTLKKGPVYECAEFGGFGILDEINMAKNETLSVIHSALDYRRVIDVPGYNRLKLHEATRFIATMNHGYIGTRDLNEALVSRFLVINMPTIEKKYLKKILKVEGGLKDEYVELFSQFFEDLQEKSLNSEISSKSIDLRGLISALELMKRGLSIKNSLEMGLMDKSFDSYEKEIVMDVCRTLFSSTINPGDIFVR